MSRLIDKCNGYDACVKPNVVQLTHTFKKNYKCLVRRRLESGVLESCVKPRNASKNGPPSYARAPG